MDSNRIQRLRVESVRQLAPGASLVLSVDGTSMAPTLEAGDRLEVRRVEGPRDLRLGDLVVVDLGTDGVGWTAAGLAVHRLLWRGRRTARTRGDGSRRMDPPVSMDDVLARVERVERAGRDVTPSATRRRWAWLTCFAAAARHRLARRWLAFAH